MFRPELAILKCQLFNKKIAVILVNLCRFVFLLACDITRNRHMKDRGMNEHD
jgi:hypothetical protein